MGCLSPTTPTDACPVPLGHLGPSGRVPTCSWPEGLWPTSRWRREGEARLRQACWDSGREGGWDMPQLIPVLAGPGSPCRPGRSRLASLTLGSSQGNSPSRATDACLPSLAPPRPTVQIRGPGPRVLGGLSARPRLLWAPPLPGPASARPRLHIATNPVGSTSKSTQRRFQGLCRPPPCRPCCCLTLVAPATSAHC